MADQRQQVAARGVEDDAEVNDAETGGWGAGEVVAGEQTRRWHWMWMTATMPVLSRGEGQRRRWDSPTAVTAVGGAVHRSTCRAAAASGKGKTAGTGVEGCLPRGGEGRRQL
ncbi:hypothetical protein E2562_009564 [Oryza meyeriana var. granulata]|uniref:DUF834 domain-containing protein n=1 Tax=Oryza meyeriana var. granulata TaxID=110450 RepID=A0A6G1F614_9ORYZ|nr:hypothetical protein E2562_009564 [Oryza meyeriana var. granulata]